MCATCGCDSVEHAHGHDHGHDHGHNHDHNHDHDHGHNHGHDDRPRTIIKLEQDVLLKNRLLAEQNRGWLAARDVAALNLMSSPGAGKTTLLERTLRDLGGEVRFAVIEGDQQTSRDAERIAAVGAPVIQINTGTGCHLDAGMVRDGLAALAPPPRSVVLIENVGNLVCPALFDLGERSRVVVFSVTEGEDKPLKYPHMFRASDVLILSKIDLLPYVPFDMEQAIGYARRVNPRLRIFAVSALRGDGLGAWYDWLRGQAAQGGRDGV